MAMKHEFKVGQVVVTNGVGGYPQINSGAIGVITRLSGDVLIEVQFKEEKVLCFENEIYYPREVAPKTIIRGRFKIIIAGRKTIVIDTKTKCRGIAVRYHSDVADEELGIAYAMVKVVKEIHEYEDDTIKVGVYVRGINNQKYTLTNERMTRAIVTEIVSDKLVKVKVLEHKLGAGINKEYIISSDVIEKIKGGRK